MLRTRFHLASVLVVTVLALALLFNRSKPVISQVPVHASVSAQDQEETYAYFPIVFHHFCGPVKDDFSDPVSGWPIAETSSWSYNYVDGEYRLYAKKGPSTTAVTRGDIGEMYTIEVDVRQVSPVNGSMGIVFHLNDDWSDFWSFEIFPPTQEAGVFHFLHGSWIGEPMKCGAIRPGQDGNHLKVACLGRGDSWDPLDYYYFFINDAALGMSPGYNYFVNPRAAVRRVGLIVGAVAPGFEVRFDNYKFLNGGCVDTPASSQSGQN